MGRFERVSSYIWEDEPSNKVRELDLNFLTTNLDNVDVGEVIKGVKGGKRCS
ncbi:hypothetical protein [Vulcanisaeta distributa]|uniref:hypothetical protein n=1 Tax=Vulcanisaeta distributa TaxID=164451 RepID=UPI000AA33F20|nr:hypothetical protein [Vulcanisaeta distributa]